MSELEVITPTELVDVRTGEVLPATPDNAAELIVAARDMRQRLLELVKDCEAVLLEESRRQGTKTLHIGDHTATVTGGKELVWDISKLTALINKAHLPEARYNELVNAIVTWKVNAAVAKQLEAANPEYAKIIQEARSYEEKPWRVSVR